MALSKIQSESINLADTFAFSGTVTGAGSEGLIHLETQEVTSAVADVKFGNDRFNTTYDQYRVFGRMVPATDAVNLYYRFLNSSESDITGTSYYRWSNNNGSTSNADHGRISSAIGASSVTECGIQFVADIWLPHVGSTADYASMVVGRTGRINNDQNPRTDVFVSQLRYDQVTTQPEGIKFYFSSGNISKALISVFVVSQG